MKIKFWITVLAVIAIGNLTMAQETTSVKGSAGVNTNRPAFVDNNKDGICDNFGTNKGKGNCNGSGRGQGMRNGKGNCKGQGQGAGKRARVNFVDANNNGICDRREMGASK